MSNANSTLTAERLRELLHYDPETGIFTWLACIGKKIKIRDVAGTKCRNGYVQIGIDGVRHRSHRLAWLYMHGVWPKDHVDHIDGNPSNNRIENLREATVSINQQNQRKARSDNKLGFLGVTRRYPGFRATIMVDGKNRHLGNYSTPELAYEAYLAAKRAHHAGCTI